MIRSSGAPIHIIGRLRRDPIERDGPLGPYVVARLFADDGATPVRVIGFQDQAERLLMFEAGDAIEIRGRAKPPAWSPDATALVIVERITSAEAQWRDALAAMGRS